MTAIGLEDKDIMKRSNTVIKILIQIYGENVDNKHVDLLFKHGIQVFAKVQTKLDILAQPGTFPKVMYHQMLIRD